MDSGRHIVTPARVATHPLAAALLRVIFGAYMVVAVLLTSLQLALDYHRQQAVLIEEVEQLAVTAEPIFAHALWNFDGDQLASNLEGILRSANVFGAQVTNPEGRALAALGSVPTSDGAARCAQLPGHGVDLAKKCRAAIGLYAIEQPLWYPNSQAAGARQRLGTLMLYTSRNVVLQRAAYGFSAVIVSALLKTLALWLIARAVINHYVARPLEKLTTAIEQFNPNQAADNLTDLALDPGRRDELAQLFHSFAAMRSALRTSNRALLHQQALLETKVAERTEKLEHASRVKGEFLSKMSHEIRTPINGVLGMTELLLDTELNTIQHNYANLIKSAGDTLLYIVNDILDYSKIEAGKMALEQVPFNLDTLVQETGALFALRSKDVSVPFHVQVAADVPRHLLGDPTRLRQILFNLLGNAFKFTQSGAVSLVVKLLRIQGSSVELRFEINDTGIGLSEQQRLHLFSAFTQADNSITRRYGGSGLGLAICKQLVELMQGEIGVNSMVGKGSTFFFSARFELASIAATHAAPVRSERPQLSHLRVLVAEDNLINQLVIRGLLNKFQIDPVIVDNGRLALDAVLTAEPPFDMVLMDCEMPELDGWSTARLLRASDVRRQNGQPLLLVGLSAHVLKEAIEQAKNAGMDDYLSKPISSQRLLEVLQRLGLLTNNE